MLAIVKTIENHRKVSPIYLYLSFAVITDCHALVHTINKANINPRIACWILKLQNYRFNIIHRDGKKMAHVDALIVSRVINLVETLPLEKELEYRQLQDPRLKFLARDLEYENHEKFDLIEGLVFRKGIDKFVIPESMIMNILRIYHDEMTHAGSKRSFMV